MRITELPLKWVKTDYSEHLMIGNHSLGSISWGINKGEDYIAYNQFGAKKANFSEPDLATKWIESQAYNYANRIMTGLNKEYLH